MVLVENAGAGAWPAWAINHTPYTSTTMAVFTDSFAQFETLLREYLEPSVEDLQIAGLDPIWDTIQASRNVTKMGRNTGTAANTPGYEARWNVKLQEGGLMEGQAFGETSLVAMGPGNKLIMGLNSAATGVDPLKVPQGSVMELKSYLKKARGAYTINQEQYESRLLAESVEDVATDAVMDVTKLVRHTGSKLLWGSGNGVVALAPTGGITIPEASVVWTSVDKAQIFRFRKGERYVAASLSSGNPATARVGNGTSPTTPSVFRCVGVKPQTLKVAFQSEPGQGTITVTAGDGIIMSRMWNWADSTSYACNGMDNLLVTDGQAFPDSGISDVTDYPELQAFIYGNETDTSTYVAPEPETIDNVLDYVTAYQSEKPPILFAENSIWTLWKHLERRANMMVVIPNGGTYDANGGVGNVMYTHGNRPFQIAASPMVAPNRIYGIDPTSFTRFMPNDMQVKWKMSNGGLAGVPSIFRPLFVGNISTDSAIAEFVLHYQLACHRPNRNVIYKGVHNKRTYDAAA